MVISLKLMDYLPVHMHQLVEWLSIRLKSTVTLPSEPYGTDHEEDSQIINSHITGRQLTFSNQLSLP